MRAICSEHFKRGKYKGEKTLKIEKQYNLGEQSKKEEEKWNNVNTRIKRYARSSVKK